MYVLDNALYSTLPTIIKKEDEEMTSIGPQIHIYVYGDRHTDLHGNQDTMVLSLYFTASGDRFPRAHVSFCK